jgi:hypothetical protein
MLKLDHRAPHSGVYGDVTVTVTWSGVGGVCSAQDMH